MGSRQIIGFMHKLSSFFTFLYSSPSVLVNETNFVAFHFNEIINEDNSIQHSVMFLLLSNYMNYLSTSAFPLITFANRLHPDQVKTCLVLVFACWISFAPVFSFIYC